MGAVVIAVGVTVVASGGRDTGSLEQAPTISPELPTAPPKPADPPITSVELFGALYSVTQDTGIDLERQFLTGIIPSVS